ncbi:MAG: HAD hydrolase-like protein [Akkermansiaceae bacterium]|jgi:phosphoglycolate phosphatase-like HAD superfamily hydrolase|nr:HAD hydrolase-like protein [Akkermansiaceae bacterium]
MARASLWLFDIDGTLLDTAGAGMSALREAAAESFGADAPPLDLAGATDLGVVAEIFGHHGVEATDKEIERFFEIYLGRLEKNLRDDRFQPRLLPGVVELLDHLEERGVTVGLLTGNLEAGARLKVRRFGIEHHFPFGAYGGEHADRNRLGPLAWQRAELHAGRSFDTGEILVIGDTPKDIACAAAIGARCLAVATGHCGVGELAAAHRVVGNLADPAGWSDFLLD